MLVQGHCTVNLPSLCRFETLYASRSVVRFRYTDVQCTHAKHAVFLSNVVIACLSFHSRQLVDASSSTLAHMKEFMLAQR